MTNSKFINQLHWFWIALPCLLSACAIKPQLFTQTPVGMKMQTVEELTQDEQSSGASLKVDELQPISLFNGHNQSSSQTATPTSSRNVDPTSFNKYTDLWQRLRQGFGLPASLNQPKVQVYLTWYQQHSYLQRIRSRAEPFLHFILEEVERREMPTELALLPAVESAFRPSAYSRNGAAGLWQFTPETGRLYDLKQNWWYDGRLDVYASTHAALSYLTYLNRYFKGDWLLTLAAYNAGPNRVLKAITQNRRQGKPICFWALRLPKETQNYVPKLLALKALVETPQKVGITLPPIAYKPVIANFEMDTQFDLGLAAMLAGVEIQEISRLNPGLKRWASDPEGPHRLFVPVDSLMEFKRRLAQLPADQRLTWLRHNIKRGDTLSSIASRYQTTVTFLQQANKLQTHRITADSYLLVPQATNLQNGYTPFKSDQRAKANSTPDEITSNSSTYKGSEKPIRYFTWTYYNDEYTG